MSDLTATRDIGRPSSRLRPTVSRPEKILFGSLCGQRLERNAKPLGRGGTFRKQRNMQWRMVSQHGVQSCVVGGVGARGVERRLDRRMRLKGEAAVQRDVKDEPEIEIDRFERR